MKQMESSTRAKSAKRMRPASGKKKKWSSFKKKESLTLKMIVIYNLCLYWL